MTRAAGTADILHVDLDAFYASVEQRADPSLRRRPVIVGGLGPRGVVAAASYEARAFGVHSAMPMGRARRACPDGVFLAPDFDAYRAASRAVMAILRSFTPLVEPIALDEAVLDVGGARRLHGGGVEIAARVRARVRAETGLTVSVGVAATKLVAKLASEEAKPDGVRVVEPGRELAFLHPLGVERLWGVGPVTRRRLEQLGVRTVGDVAALPAETLEHALGRAHGAQLHALAHNRDDRAVEPVRQPKSLGHEETFPRDVADRDALARHLLRFAEQVAARLRDAAQLARTVQLKARYGDFRTVTRSRTLAEATQQAADLQRVGQELLGDLDLRDGLRLLGLAAHQLTPAAGAQTSLPLEASPVAPGRDALERSVEDVRRRFGADAVTRARAPERR